jgi:hypothetical protein
MKPERRDFMRMILAGFTTGLVLGVACVFEEGVIAKSAPFLLLAFFLAGASFGLIANWHAMVAASLVAAGPFMVGLTKIVIDLRHDPTSHNLLPFEAAAELAIGFLPTVVGFLAGYVIKRLASPPSRAFLVPATCALLVALLSPLLALMIDQRDQDHAVRMLRSLWQAEQAYAARDSEHRFTCEGPLLQGFEQRPWFAWTSMGLSTKGNLSDGAYLFRVSCGELSRGDAVAVYATPKLRGGTAICIDGAGAIHSGVNLKPNCGE